MPVVKSFLIAFSIYSKIPVPQFPWKDSDMRYVLCFFPCVGLVIGAAVYGWNLLCGIWGIGSLCRILIMAALPLAITGGFHMDGFLDTMDAFHSYQPKERKLEILKDSHIGAFAVIMLVLELLVNLAGISEIRSGRAIAAFGMGFVISRIFSGLGVVCCPPARKDGMLVYFADTAHKRMVKAVLLLELLLGVGAVFRIGWYYGIVLPGIAVLVFGYYFWKTGKELGGVTGDTAGYFVVVCECAFSVAIPIAERLAQFI